MPNDQGHDHGYPPFPPQNRRVVDHEAHQRIAVLEHQMSSLNGQLLKLEGKFDAVQTDVTHMKASMADVVSDLKWMRGELMPLVKGNRSESNTAKALGLIGLLIAVLAGVLGIANIPGL